MTEIKFIDGTPCIVLDDGKPRPKRVYHDPRNLAWQDFTTIQQSKEAKSFKSVLDELKDKFKE